MLAAGCVCIWALLTHVVREPPSAFDQSRWLAAANWMGSNDPRATMLPSLLRQHLRVGLSSREVERLLGQPTYRAASGVWRYRIAYRNDLGLGKEFLDIQFGDDLVVAYKVR